MASYPEFISQAGACLASTNVLSRAGRVRWMVRVESKVPVDNGWRIFSHIDSEEYLADPKHLVVTDFNAVCAIEPALIGIYDFAVGSDLQIVDDGERIAVVDTATGREIPPENFYVPPSMRA
jgi:hypothetical protein